MAKAMGDFEKHACKQAPQEDKQSARQRRKQKTFAKEEARLMLASWSRRGAAQPSAAAGCVERCVASTENARGRGTFCRLGSSMARRPVAHDVWQKLPRMRTSAPFCALKYENVFLPYYIDLMYPAREGCRW